jgi:nitrite reductase (NO-forming)
MNKNKFIGLMAVMIVATFTATTACASEPEVKSNSTKAADPTIQGEEIAVLTVAPNVPPPIKRKHATKVIVNMEVREVIKRLSDGVDYLFWTFGGEVPGQFIRIREGDLVEFHLNNHQSSKLPHNIDLHAVTGPGGGAASSFTAPGHSSKFSFKAINPGLYVYHCATAPVGVHVGNGMYGMILVEPKEGLPPVDREYYIMQSEFYTIGKYGEEGFQAFDMDKAVEERPSYVVFNGSVGALVGDKAITAKVGEKVRLFVGNGGPNLVSSFHVIGEIFDTVYQEGGVMPSQRQVQTTMIPAGGSAIVEFGLDVPGTYVLVDHSLFRAFNKGAVGMMKVDGPANGIIYSGKESDTVYTGEPFVSESKLAAVTVPKEPVALVTQSTTAPADSPLSAQMQRGKLVYGKTCTVCHQPDARGVPEQIPPLAKSDYLMADKERSIRGVINGQSGPMTVNGKNYNGIMVPLNYLTDEEVADVLTYVRNSFGNSGEAVTAAQVTKVRSDSPAVAVVQENYE